MSSNSSQIEADAEFARRLQEEELRSAAFLMGPSFLPDRRRAPYFLFGAAGAGAAAAAPSTSNSGTASASHNNSNTRASPSTNPSSGVPDRAPAPYAYTPGRDEGPAANRPQTHTHHHFQYFHQTGGPANEPSHPVPDFMDAFDHLHMMFPGFPRMNPSPSSLRRARRPPFGGGATPGAVDAMAEMSRLMGEFPSFFNDDNFGHPHVHGGGGGGSGGGGASFFATGAELPAFFRNILGHHHPNTYEEFLEMIERRGNVNRGATEEELTGIRTERYQPPPRAASSAAGAAAGTDDAEKCVICLAEFERGEEVKRLPCNHIFHGECVDRWLRVNRTCPSCKRSIRRSDSQHQE